MDIFVKIAIFFEKGGIWMWVILALQVVSIIIIVERSIELFLRRKPLNGSFVNQFEKNIRGGQLDEVMEKAKDNAGQHSIARVVLVGSKTALSLGGQDEIQGKMDEVLLEESNRLERRTGFLAMLGNVGTLTGLLGTIVGMIKAFSAVTYADPVEKASLLSSGISEAMNTTAYGLIVAIPALIMFSILQNRSNILVEDLNQGALKVYNWLSYAYDPIKRKVKAG